MNSADLLLTSLFFILLLGGIIGNVGERSDAALSTAEAAASRSINLEIYNALNEAYNGNEGHMVDINLPPSINGKSYRVQVNSTGIYLDVGGWKNYNPLVGFNIAGDPAGVSLSPGNHYKIINSKNKDKETELKII